MIFLKILGTKTKFSQPLTNCGTHIVGQKWNINETFPRRYFSRLVQGEGTLP